MPLSQCICTNLLSAAWLYLVEVLASCTPGLCFSTTSLMWFIQPSLCQNSSGTFSAPTRRVCTMEVAALLISALKQFPSRFSYTTGLHSHVVLPLSRSTLPYHLTSMLWCSMSHQLRPQSPEGSARPGVLWPTLQTTVWVTKLVGYPSGKFVRTSAFQYSLLSAGKSWGSPLAGVATVAVHAAAMMGMTTKKQQQDLLHGMRHLLTKVLWRLPQLVMARHIALEPILMVMHCLNDDSRSADPLQPQQHRPSRSLIYNNPGKPSTRKQ
mmetsp:Transcript_48687/g.128384  ORF Transcript_48687/g.128384 Transcript_48687/m.128384 type:complete len:267 (+) Transcript_48687:270-1070(+)